MRTDEQVETLPCVCQCKPSAKSHGRLQLSRGFTWSSCALLALTRRKSQVLQLGTGKRPCCPSQAHGSFGRASPWRGRMTAVLRSGRGSKELRQGWERKPEPAEGRAGASRGWGTARMERTRQSKPVSSQLNVLKPRSRAKCHAGDPTCCLKLQEGHWHKLCSWGWGQARVHAWLLYDAYHKSTIQALEK